MRCAALRCAVVVGASPLSARVGGIFVSCRVAGLAQIRSGLGFHDHFFDFCSERGRETLDSGLGGIMVLVRRRAEMGRWRRKLTAPRPRLALGEAVARLGIPQAPSRARSSQPRHPSSASPRRFPLLRITTLQRERPAKKHRRRNTPIANAKHPPNPGPEHGPASCRGPTRTAPTRSDTPIGPRSWRVGSAQGGPIKCSSRYLRPGTCVFFTRRGGGAVLGPTDHGAHERRQTGRRLVRRAHGPQGCLSAGPDQRAREAISLSAGWGSRRGCRGGLGTWHAKRQRASASPPTGPIAAPNGHLRLRTFVA